ncbi:MAG: Hpt domain-containing protein [Magnetococcus sp. WYHC-3]
MAESLQDRGETAVTELQVLDLAYLEELRSSLGVDVCREIVEQFPHTRDQCLTELRAIPGERTSLRHALHRLRGGAGSLGMHALMAVCEQAQRCDPRDDERWNAICARVVEELHRADQSLNQWIQVFLDGEGADRCHRSPE